MSNWIYKDETRNEKCRLIVKKHPNNGTEVYTCECKNINHIASDPSGDYWMPYFSGTAEFMQLTEQEKQWAKR